MSDETVTSSADLPLEPSRDQNDGQGGRSTRHTSRVGRVDQSLGEGQEHDNTR